MHVDDVYFESHCRQRYREEQFARVAQQVGSRVGATGQEVSRVQNGKRQEFPNEAGTSL